MSFDANKFQEACRPWIFSAGTSSWTAKPVSAPALARFHAEFADVTAAATMDLLEARSPRDRARIQRDAERSRIKLLTRLLRLAYRWRGDPVRALLELPVAARDEALKSFFLWTGEKPNASAPPRPSASPIPGTPSSPPSASP